MLETATSCYSLLIHSMLPYKLKRQHQLLRRPYHHCGVVARQLPFDCDHTDINLHGEEGHTLTHQVRILICLPSTELLKSFKGDPETLNTKSDSWSDNGVRYTSAVIASLVDGAGSQLLYEYVCSYSAPFSMHNLTLFHRKSRYLFPDGTLRARLEAKLVKSESTKDCIIC